MRLDCANLERIAHSISLVQECDVVRNGALRLSTPFVYPNGSNIDIFLGHGESLFEDYVLSDFGMTGLYLENAQVKMESTDRRRQVLADICAELGVKFENGVFRIFLDRDQIADISDAVFRLSQACVRVSDFATHQRLRSANPFRDDVEDFLEASGLHPKPDAKVRGPYGSDIKLDFEVQRSFVLVLAAMNEPAAHSSANEIFAKWHDLKTSGYQSQRKFVTVYNSESPAIRSSDIQRLGDYSISVSYPEQAQQLVEVLAA